MAIVHVAGRPRDFLFFGWLRYQEEFMRRFAALFFSVGFVWPSLATAQTPIENTNAIRIIDYAFSPARITVTVRITSRTLTGRVLHERRTYRICRPGA